MLGSSSPAPSASPFSAFAASPVPPLLRTLGATTASSLSYEKLTDGLKGKEAEWKGMVVLITGAGSGGIGTEVVRKAASHGAKVVLGDVAAQEENLTKLVEEIKAKGGEAIYCICDVTSWEDQCELFRSGLERYGKIDIVVANAGIALPDVDLDSADEVKKPNLRVLDVNLSGVVYTSILATHYLRKDASSTDVKSLVIIGSLGSFVAAPGVVLYNASKHAVLGLARSLAPCLAALDIGTFLIAPSYVSTPIHTPHYLEVLKSAGVPLIRAEDVATATLSAAVESWREVTTGEVGGTAVLLDADGATAIRLNVSLRGDEDDAVKARL